MTVEENTVEACYVPIPPYENTMERSHIEKPLVEKQNID